VGSRAFETVKSVHKYYDAHQRYISLNFSLARAQRMALDTHIHPRPMEILSGERGSPKPKGFKGKYEAKLKILEG